MHNGLEDMVFDVLGVQVHCVHAGSGRPMLLIHGLVGSASNWRRNIGALAQDASVYAIDLVNMGQSQRVAGIDAGLEATADRVAACMDALGVAQADIAGHSHGGAVAMVLAARHPERVRSLILFAPANPFSHLADPLVRVYNTAFGSLCILAAPYVPLPLQIFALARMYGNPARISLDSLQGYMDPLQIPGTAAHVLAIVHGWFDDMAKLEAALPMLAETPILLIWGGRDRAVDPASARRLQRVLPQSQLCVVRGAGHILFEEMPEEANRLMLEWLRRDVASPATKSRAKHDSTAKRRPRRPLAAARPRVLTTLG